LEHAQNLLHKDKELNGGEDNPKSEGVVYQHFNPENHTIRQESEVEYLRQELRAANRRIDELVGRLLGNYNTKSNQTQSTTDRNFQINRPIRTPSAARNRVQGLVNKAARDKVTEKIVELEQGLGIEVEDNLDPDNIGPI
jgi:hypothetical protein